MSPKTSILLLKSLVVFALLVAVDHYIPNGPLSKCISVWALSYVSWSSVANQNRLAPGPKVPKWVAYLCGFPDARRIDTRTIALQLSVIAASLLALVALVFSPDDVVSLTLLGLLGTAACVVIWGSTQTIDNQKPS